MAKDLLTKHLEEVVNPTWNYAKRCETEQDHHLNAVLGLAGEAGEVVDIYKKNLFHKPKDRKEDLLAELGDVGYYYIKTIDVNDLSLEEVLDYNRRKLFKRYELDGK